MSTPYTPGPWSICNNSSNQICPSGGGLPVARIELTWGTAGLQTRGRGRKPDRPLSTPRHVRVNRDSLHALVNMHPVTVWNGLDLC